MSKYFNILSQFIKSILVSFRVSNEDMYARLKFSGIYIYIL